MNTPQAGILLPLPPRARYLSFVPDAGGRRCRLPAGARQGRRWRADGRRPWPLAAVGAGGRHRRPAAFPSLAGAGVELPATPAAIWVWLRGEDRGELLQRARRIERLLAPAFRLAETLDAFVHDGGRDLSGYEDGTENPVGDAATAAAIVGAERPSLAGSSFVAVQRWLHDLARFEQMSPDDRDLCIGRRRRGNEEIDDAPESAHVKRTAQESFTPPAFVLRRSMPWTEGPRGGLLFVAFATSFDPFEAQLRRMVGIEDGIVDALFRFTRPQSGAYFWCPAMRAGRLDLSPLRL
jgi:putative iron-dependent peroxidase